MNSKLYVSAKNITSVIAIMAALFFTPPAFCGWEIQDTGTAEYLTDIFFVDENHGWVVGENSTILRTTDGGETWVHTDIIDEDFTYNFKCVEFADPEVGYLIGTPSGDGLTFRHILFRSADGGVTWE